MEIITRGSTQDFTPIEVVILVTSQQELDAINELSVLNVNCGVDAGYIRDDLESGVDEFLDKLNAALDDC